MLSDFVDEVLFCLNFHIEIVTSLEFIFVYDVR